MKKINHWIFRQIFYSTLLLRREWFFPQYHELLESQYFPPEKLKELQLMRLNALLRHASENIRYYKGRIPSKLEDLDGLSSLPLLEKEDVRKHQDDLTCKIGSNQRLKTSGGSTGAPVTLVKDSAGMAYEMAAMWRGYSWAGVKIGHRQARFWGVPKTRKEKLRASLIDFVCNRKRITAFNFDVESMRSATKSLMHFKPDYFYGYTSIIKEFALAQNGKSKLSPKAIFTTSEVLTSGDRQLLEDTFSCKVFDEYGCGEVGTIAHECEYGVRHINVENVIVEVVDDNGIPVPSGNSGELVVTDLTNWSMPLIRYRLKDYGSIAVEKCKCGRSLQRLGAIHGRAYDVLKNTMGKRFHGEFFLYIVEDAKKSGLNINGIQFAQRIDLGIDVSVVCSVNDFYWIKEFIFRRLISDFDNCIDINIERKNVIPREPSGKIRVVKGIE